MREIGSIMRLLCVVIITCQTYKDYNSVNKLNLTGLLYVAWIDRFFVCRLFRAISYGFNTPFKVVQFELFVV